MLSGSEKKKVQKSPIPHDGNNNGKFFFGHKAS